MKRLAWRPLALADRDRLMAHIAQDSPAAAISLDETFENHAERARQSPALYQPGRMKGTREIVVRPNYVMVYRIDGDVVVVLRVLHATQQWPPSPSACAPWPAAADSAFDPACCQRDPSP